MMFSDLDARMRVYETAHDLCALPGLFLVARLDGRSFTRLATILGYERPFDPRFRDVMVGVVRHLMACGVRCSFGYTQSDEISLLLDPRLDAFGRKERKLLSILAGEASGAASLAFGMPVALDCRLSQLPSEQLVVDYFRWRQEDAARNALNAHCHWRLRGEGHSGESAYAAIAGFSTAAKHELLYSRGVNFDGLPAWQKRGIGVRWGEATVTGIDPRDGRAAEAVRTQLVVDGELPLRDEYARYVRGLLQRA
jgi:tRNA(His) guanylyltransferase